MRPNGFRSGFPERARLIKSVGKTDAQNVIREFVSRLRRVQGCVVSARFGKFRARHGSKNKTDHAHANAEV
jgi:hypothetical protein